MKHSDSTLKEDQTFPGWIWLHSGLFLAAMQMDFNYDLVNLAIPLLAISFGASSLQLGLLGALQRMLYIFVCPVSGRLSDRWGRKGLALSGTLMFAGVCLTVARTTGLGSIFWAVPGIGLTLGFFWPALQGWLSDQGENRVLSHSTSLFNLFWSTGSMLGMVSAGILTGFSSKLPFYVAAGVAVTIALILTRISHKGRSARFCLRDESSGPIVTESDWDHAQRRAALVSIFLSFLVIGGVTTQFPKLATQLGYSTALIGLTMGFLPLTRTFGFGFLGRWKVQENISKPLTLTKLVLGAAMLVFVLANSSLVFMLAFALLGLVAAGTFSFSQYLCLKNPLRAGQRIGLHESSMLAGIVIGSLLFGLLAQRLGIRSTFGFGMLLSVLALTAQPALFYGYARKAMI